MEQAHARIEALKSACLQVSEKPTLENVEKLRTTVSDCDPFILCQLQKFVIFPHVVALNKHNGLAQNLKVKTIESLELTLSKVEVTDEDCFTNVFSCLTCTLSPPVAMGKVAELSEELVTCIISCLLALFKHLSLVVLKLVYTSKNLPILGHAVSTLLHLAEHEKSRRVKVTAMDCILEISQAKSTDANCMAMAGAVFASFLPGISMTTCKIAIGDPKQGQAVIEKALETFSGTVSLVLNDSHLLKPDKDSDCDNKQKYQELVVRRTESWVKGTAEKLNVLVQRIAEIASNDNWRVRVAVVHWAENLLKHCFGSLKESVSVFVDTLVALSCDDYNQVAKKSSCVLEKLLLDRTKRQRLMDAMDDSLQSLVTSLPRLIRSTDDAEKLIKLRHFRGLVNLMGDRVDAMPYEQLHKILLSVVHLVELDCSDIKVLEERLDSSSQRIEAHMLQGLARPQKHFKHFRDPRIHSEIQTLCRALSGHLDVVTSVESLLDMFIQSSVHYKQAIIVSNEIILGASGQKGKKIIESDVLESLVQLLVTEYTNKLREMSTTLTHSLESAHTDASLTIFNSQPEAGTTLMTMKNNIWVSCLLLESYGMFSHVLGPRLNVLMMEFLYTLLEMLGHESAFISVSAYFSLQDICDNCGYDDIGGVICQNADYLLSTLSLHLRRIERHPAAPVVLHVILRYSDGSILALLYPTIEELLMAVDMCYEELQVPILKVMCTLVTSIVKWFPAPDIGTPPTGNLPGQRNNVSDIAQYFREYHRAKQIAEGDFSDFDVDGPTSSACDQEPTEPDNEDCGENEKAKPPRHVKLLTEVLERCRHFVSSKHPSTRILVLDLIACGCQALKDYEKELLPMIHKLWPPLVERFQDNDAIVMSRAFATFRAMAKHAGSFIRNRSVKDALPKISEFLQKQSVVSAKGSHNYHHTLAFKLQLSVLNGIGEVCKFLEIAEIDLFDVAQACLPYLNARQPTVLQQACKKTFEFFIDTEPDAMWLLLADVYYDKELVPPGDDFKAVLVGGQSCTNVEYAENICYLLKLCNE